MTVRSHECDLPYGLQVKCCGLKGHSTRCDKRRMGKGRRGITPRTRGGCSTIELGRHMEPATGVEPITRDNPQLRPIKIPTCVHSRKKVVSLCAVVSSGAKAALLKSCVPNRTDTSRCGQASREALCFHERCAHRASPSFLTGSLCGACW